MKRLPEEVIQFLGNQGFVIVSTIDRNKTIHSSCKGIVKINKNGRIYLLDLYMKRTYENIKRNPHITVTAVDEHRFTGWCLKGKAKIISSKELSPKILKAWEDKITSRITQRVIKNIHGEKGHPQHPEVRLPHPQYLITMEVQDLVDLTPRLLKQ